MIQHFSFKPLYENHKLPGWSIAFFYKQKHFNADYLKDGTIVWTKESPDNQEKIEKMIHELMLFHVYD